MLMLSPTPIMASWLLYVGVVLWRFFCWVFCLNIFLCYFSELIQRAHALPSGSVLFTFTVGSRCAFSFMQANGCDMYVMCAWPGHGRVRALGRLPPRRLAAAACAASLRGFVYEVSSA